MKLFLEQTEIKTVTSRGRYLRIKIDNATAQVTVYIPKGMSVARAQQFIEEKRGWIEKNLAIARQNVQSEVDGGGLAVIFGKTYSIIPIESGKPFLGEDALYLNIPRDCSLEREKVALQNFYKNFLSEYISVRLPYFQTLIGLNASGFSIRNMRSRWGSCNTVTGKLTFSLRLVKKTPDCIDYVSAHELCHIAHANHGSEFKRLLTRYMPDWKRRKNLLNGV